MNLLDNFVEKFLKQTLKFWKLERNDFWSFSKTSKAVFSTMQFTSPEKSFRGMIEKSINLNIFSCFWATSFRYGCQNFKLSIRRKFWGDFFCREKMDFFGLGAKLPSDFAEKLFSRCIEIAIQKSRGTFCALKKLICSLGFCSSLEETV